MNSKKIILISNPRILKIPIKENNEELVDLKTKNFLLDNRNESKYFSMIRKSVAEKLLKAQKNLPKDMHLLIIEAYRPLSLQKEYFDEYVDELEEAHPDWNKEMFFKEASKYVAPPDIIPPHTTGAAVDLTLIDSNGKELDMGSQLNQAPEESNNTCYTYSENISPKAKKNRKLLIKIMSEAGFVNYLTEWWHWSYGDRYWAYFKKKPFAFYNTI